MRIPASLAVASPAQTVIASPRQPAKVQLAFGLSDVGLMASIASAEVVDPEADKKVGKGLVIAAGALGPLGTVGLVAALVSGIVGLPLVPIFFALVPAVIMLIVGMLKHAHGVRYMYLKTGEVAPRQPVLDVATRSTVDALRAPRA